MDLKFNNNEIGDCPECGVPLFVSVRRSSDDGQPRATIVHKFGFHGSGNVGTDQCSAWESSLTDEEILKRVRE